jgi:hypothetical protein
VRTTGKLSREACKEAGMPVQSAYNRLKKLTFELRKELKRRLA